MSGHNIPSPPATTLDPPFRGYIETTFDALLVFEAARRGMIPRVTRRLIERERSMVQSGAVFVFDEHESGIKRWTDGLIWSPSRILGNFLVYRQTDKGPTKPSTPTVGQGSPSGSSPSSTPQNRPSSGNAQPLAQNNEASGSSSRQDDEMSTPLGQGQLHRPRSASEGGAGVDRARERQLVGSLTNSYKFTSGGLVKKTMSVVVNDYAQHMISYYTMDDALAGRLRTPSSIPELAALEIASEYLTGQSFRFPPRVEFGPDGKPRYRGEPDLPNSPQSPAISLSMQSFPPGDYYDPYNTPMPPHLRMDPNSRRSVTGPVPLSMNDPTPLPPSTYMSPAQPTYYDQSHMQVSHPITRQDSNSSQHSIHTGPPPLRPSSSSRRYEPYGPTSPRLGSSSSSSLQMTQSSHHHNRRQSQPQPIPAPGGNYYSPPQDGYDVKPNISNDSGQYSYHPPSTAPGSFAQFYPHGHGQPTPLTPQQPSAAALGSPYPSHHQPHYAASTTWAHPSSAPTSRLLPSGSPGGTGERNYSNHQPPNPPSSSGSSGSGGVADSWASHVLPGGGPAVWESGPGISNGGGGGGMQYGNGIMPHGEDGGGGTWRRDGF